MHSIKWAYIKSMQAFAYSKILDPIGLQLYTVLAMHMWSMGIGIPKLMQISGILPGTKENKKFQDTIMH